MLSLRDGMEQWRTATTYDGDRVTTIPPSGGTASVVISNGLGQKVMTRQFKDRAHTGPNDPADTTTYHRSGLLHTFKDSTGANTWSYSYDLLGRKVSQTDPDSGTRTTTYDAAGQVLTTTDARGQTLANTYDNLGRKTGLFDTSTSGTRLASWLYDTKLKASRRTRCATRAARPTCAPSPTTTPPADRPERRRQHGTPRVVRRQRSECG